MKQKTNKLTVALLLIYAAVMIWVVLFKMATPAEFGELDHIRRINLIPFHYDQEVSSHLSEILENLAAFIPLGLYLSMLRVKWWKAVLWGAAASLAFETAQYIMSIGASDVTDLITNTAGGALGVGLYGLLTTVFKKRETLNRVLNVLALIATVALLSLLILLFLINR